MASTLALTLLGQFQLRIDGAPVEPPLTGRLQSAVCALALAHPRPIPRQHLAILLWPEALDAQARTNLRNILHKLRHEWPALGRAVGDADQDLFWTPESAIRVDVNEFEAACREPDPDRASALYTGDFLPDCYDEWVLVKRHQLQTLFLTSLERRITRLAQAGQDDAAVLDLHRYLALDPLREDIHRALIRLLAHKGDRAGALAAYQHLAQLLQRELGVPPSPATQRLHARLLSDDPGLVTAAWSLDGPLA